MLDPEAIDVTRLLLFNAAKAKSGNSGSRSVVLSDSRGRRETDAAARSRAPDRRRRHAAGCRAVPENPAGMGTRPHRDREEGDLRAKLPQRKAGALVVFLVDASGSMALNRMQSAKGADPFIHRGLRKPRRGGPDPIPRRSGGSAAAPHLLDHRRPPSAGIGRGGLSAHGLTQAARVGVAFGNG